MKTLFIFSLLITLTTSLFAQNLSQVVKGKIIDQESKTELIGATIMLLNNETLIGTSTNIDGVFKMNVPLGRQSFKVSYIDYEDVTIPNVLVSSGKEIELTIEMRESFSKINEVVVTANVDKTVSLNTMASISARQLRSEDASRYAGGFYDPARMVSGFAGVAATEGDGTNQIVVRGNSPRGLLWRLEGIEIPNPNHFPDGQGDSGGAFCILSSSVLSSFDFYSSAFPAEYGNAYSGIMDLNMRKGNSDKREYSLIVGLVGTQLSMEGPFKKGYDGSYLISYRYSNFGLLNRAGLLGLAENHLPPLFQDLNFNVYLPTKKAGLFKIFGSGGNSWTGWEAYQDSSKWFSWDDRKDDLENHLMGVLGLKHTYNFKDNKTYIRTVVALTHQSDSLSTTFLMDGYEPLNAYNSHFAYDAFRANMLVNHKFNSRNSVRAGVIFNQLYSNMYSRKYNWSTEQQEVQIDQSNHTYLAQAYLQWKYRITEKMELNTGLHAMYFGLNNDYSIEPRLGWKWNFAKNQSISAGFGMHTRTENIPAYFADVINDNGEIGEFNRNLSFTKSLHNVIGYDWSINKDLRLKLEAYYQHIYNVPVVDTLNSTMSALNFAYGIPDVVLTNKGTGRNYGMEFTLEKFYSNNYYFLFTTSLFDSKYLANDGNWYNTVYNNQYLTNFLIGKDFKVGKEKQNILGVNLKALVRGGFRYTPIDFEKSIAAGDEVYDWSRSFAEQFPLYNRFDFGMNYQQNLKKWNWSVALNILNVLNQQNIAQYYLKHNDKTNEYSIAGISGLGLVPNLNFKIEF
ncbi:MAG: TonB-dependent receptor [Prolixibacteraceae bacterium]|nr:TonB-dependent receptor [Prolixibacteraceae bacterium]